MQIFREAEVEFCFLNNEVLQALFSNAANSIDFSFVIGLSLTYLFSHRLPSVEGFHWRNISSCHHTDVLSLPSLW